MSSEMPMALIRFTASMKRLTTTGASPSTMSSLLVSVPVATQGAIAAIASSPRCR